MSDQPAYMQGPAAVAAKIAELRRARRAALNILDTQPLSDLRIWISQVDEYYGILAQMIVRDALSMAQVEELLDVIRREEAVWHGSPQNSD